jgi:hypothetical protein
VTVQTSFEIYLLRIESFVLVGAACSRDGARESRLEAAPTNLGPAQGLGKMQLHNLNEYSFKELWGFQLRSVKSGLDPSVPYGAKGYVVGN